MNMRAKTRLGQQVLCKLSAITPHQTIPYTLCLVPLQKMILKYWIVKNGENQFNWLLVRFEMLSCMSLPNQSRELVGVVPRSCGCDTHDKPP